VGYEIEHVYFLESGLGSLIVAAGPDEIEVAQLGAEGMSGLQLLSGVTTSTHRVCMQMAGSGLRKPRESFVEVLDECPAALSLFTRYREAFAVQVEQTALANGRFSLMQRLARWLLMCQDRMGDAPIRITHDSLGLMLGVRRAGITTALHVLEGEHAIRSSRGEVMIRDRAGLLIMAGCSYGVPEAAYAALVGSSKPAAANFVAEDSGQRRGPPLKALR
jgi:CRP-like cAMP-binding protein